MENELEAMGIVPYEEGSGGAPRPPISLEQLKTTALKGKQVKVSGLKYPVNSCRVHMDQRHLVLYIAVTPELIQKRFHLEGEGVFLSYTYDEQPVDGDYETEPFLYLEFSKDHEHRQPKGLSNIGSEYSMFEVYYEMPLASVKFL